MKLQWTHLESVLLSFHYCVSFPFPPLLAQPVTYGTAHDTYCATVPSGWCGTTVRDHRGSARERVASYRIPAFPMHPACDDCVHVSSQCRVQSISLIDVALTRLLQLQLDRGRGIGREEWERL
jgi:hypothetical protein